MTLDFFQVLKGLDAPTLAIIAAEAELALRVQEAIKGAGNQKVEGDKARESDNEKARGKNDLLPLGK